MSEKKDHIDKLTPEIIARYYEGSLSNKEMHEVEKLMLDSDFEAEAMEGFESMEPNEIRKDIDVLNQRLDTKINTSNKRGAFFYLKIAASLLIIVASFFLIIDYLQPETSVITQVETSDKSNEQQKQSDAFKTEQEPKERPQNNASREEKSAKQEDITDLDEVLDYPNKKRKQPEAQDAIISEQNKGMEVEEMQKSTLSEASVEKIETIATAEVQVEEGAGNNDMESVSEPVAVEEALSGRVAGVAVESVMQAKEESVKRMNAAKKSVTPASIAALDTPTSQLTGKVISAEDGTALPGINVIVDGTASGTVTDVDGNFSLTIPENSDSTLVFSFVGLASERIDAKGKNNLTVSMEADVAQLSEVVVVGYGETKDNDTNDNTFEAAHPYIGNSEYKSYIETNVQYPEGKTESGRVIIKFKVNPDGSLSDFEIRRSMGEAFDNEALRLIKEGPKWIPAKNNDTAIEDYVRVRVKFEPQE